MLASIESTPYLESVMTLRNQSFSFASLTEILSEFGDHDDVIDFIDSLIESKVIISILEPFVTGQDLLPQTIEKLKAVSSPFGEGSLKYLEQIDQSVLELDLRGPGKSLSLYKGLREHIETLDISPPKDSFQVDLITQTAQCTLDAESLESIRIGIAVLNKCSNHLPNFFQNFKREFYAKFEDEEIPLLEALDSEIGVLFGGQSDVNGNRIIKGLEYGSVDSDKSLSFTAFDQILLEKFIDYTRDGSEEIVFEEKDLTSIDPQIGQLPDTIFSVCEMIESIDSQKLIYISHVGGASAANIIGRFCHSNGDIHDLALEIIEKENAAKPNTILAEIVHIPQSRIGNIVLRPHLRDYEIPIITDSSLDEDHIIRLDDLMISVRNGRDILLRSKKLNKAIQPVLTNAHNYINNTVPVYRFLSSLQAYNTKQAFAFSWNKFFTAKDHLPRVRYNNIILSLARWTVKLEEIPKDSGRDDIYLESSITALFSNRKIPSHVWLVDGDNKIYLDITNKWCKKIFFQELKRKRKIELNEFLHNPDRPIVTDLNGSIFPHEILTFFYKNYQK